MNTSPPIVRKLQSDAVSPDVPVSVLLRTAKIVAVKLDLQDALEWIDRELGGYMDVSTDDLPKYRRLTGDPKGWNPYHGWQSIHISDPKTAKIFSSAPIGQALGSIEEGLRGRENGSLIFPYPPKMKSQLTDAIRYTTDVHIELDYGSIYNIVDSVRNLILNWSLELEKAGILGEDMTFSVDEKREAAPITQQVFAQNIGFVGNVSDQAQMSNLQTATMDAHLDVAQIGELAAQVREVISRLPEDVRTAVEPTISDLEGELANKEPSQSRLRELLSMVRTICEGAVGNLVAQGILGMLKNLL